MPTLDRDGEVYVLTLDETENRFHPDWLAQVGEHLDTVAAAEGPRALVTAGVGKFFSNGLDLEWMMSHGDQAADYVRRVHGLFATTLLLPLPTVAALNGHVFAAGAMWALSHDFRVMRADRGFFCLPEVDINIPFTPGMSALVQSRLTRKAAHEAMTTGRRYGGTEAADALIVDEANTADQVLPAALERARLLAGKAGATLGAIKERMYAPVIAELTEGDIALG